MSAFSYSLSACALLAPSRKAGGSFFFHSHA